MSRQVIDAVDNDGHPTAWHYSYEDEETTTEQLPIPEPSDLEERAGVASLEELQTRRRLLIERNTKLFALYGPFGMFDDYRKKMVEAQKIGARQALTDAGIKATESMVDSHAYGGEAYGKFMDTALEEKIEYLRIATEVTEIEEEIRNREIALRAYTVEAGLR